MEIELFKYKDRDASQINELTELRQSSALFAREKLNLQIEINSLRNKLFEEETAHEKVQEQLKRIKTDKDTNHYNEEIIKDLERKLDVERLELKKSDDELVQTQKKIHMLEKDLKEMTTNYTQLIYDYKLSKQSIEKMESDNQRLTDKLRNITNEYETIKTKFYQNFSDLVESKISVDYRTQTNGLNDEIGELTEKLRQVDNKQKNIEEETNDVFKELEMENVKLKTDSVYLNLLQEQCTELEKEKLSMINELDATKKQFNTRFSLLDSEINTFRSQYEKSQYDLKQAINDREVMANKFKQVLDQLHDLERQIPELRKKADDERVKKEAAVKKLEEIVKNPLQIAQFSTRPTGNSRRHDRDDIQRLEQALEVERLKYEKLQNEKNEEINILTKNINKLKHELNVQRDEIEKFKQQLEPRDLNNNITSTYEEIYDDRKESSVEIQKKTNIQKNGWEKQFAVIAKNKFLLYNSGKDQQAVISIDIDKIYHVRAVSEGDVLHAHSSTIPKIFQIIYNSQGQTSPNPLSSSLISPQNQDHHNNETIAYKGHNFVIVTYLIKTECEVCNRPCYNSISSSPCLQCIHCRTRCHKQHYDNGEII